MINMIVAFAIGFLIGALGAVGFFTYTGSTLKWKVK